ncbi:hypothetical protein GWK48_01070 [Metallosphaera tengchongensis]|uniref:5,10-methenyltetrahydrofolate synthetase n=1 Tax=Metallosphaera tengchongensis TaxID=1532350 RepID=A0A6N0NVK3_9CREN|nr:hypothetical protein [Metallosphaera tengchongensis]QKQ99170.1 hypothetical protein GWK48_01070 [Metallosphaera tengchongensis]
MEILAEVHAKWKLEKLKKEIDLLSEFDGYDIPDAALGEPSVIPSVVGTLIRERLGNKRIILNQRLVDVNELFVRSLSITSRMMNFDVAFTQGDKPKFGHEVNQLSSQRAIEIAKSYNVRAGGMISLRKSKDEIFSRLDLPADFFLGLHFSGVKSILNLPLDKIIPYVIIRTDKNKEILKGISQPYFETEEVKLIIDQLAGLNVKSVLISVPGDVEYLSKIVRK